MFSFKKSELRKLSPAVNHVVPSFFLLLGFLGVTQHTLSQEACRGWHGPADACGESAYSLARDWCDAEALAINGDGGDISVWQVHSPTSIAATCGIYVEGPSGKNGIGIRHAGFSKEGEFYYDDDKNECEKRAEQAGNPINVRTGIKTQIEEDTATPMGSELGIKRIYSHTNYTPTEWRWPFAESGMHLNIRDKLFDLPCLTPLNGGGCSSFYLRAELYVDAYRQDGSVARFDSRNNAGEFLQGVSLIDIYKQVTVSGLSITRGMSLLYNENSDRWELSDNKGTEFYSVDGTYLGANRKNGYSYEITLDANDHVDRVDDNLGHWLDFSFGQAVGEYNYGKVVFIESSTGEVVHYTYDTNGWLISVGYGEDKNNLSGFVYKQYHYEDSNYPSGLTGITDENNHRYATWTYAYFDDEGWAGTSSSHGSLGAMSYQDLVDALIDTNYTNSNIIDLTTINYTVIGSNGSDATQVINPLGKKTRYDWTVVSKNGIYDDRIKVFNRIKGAQSANCNQAWKNFEYDSFGYVNAKTKWGDSFGFDSSYHHVTFVNDDRGLPLTISYMDGYQQPVRTIKKQWDAFKLKTDEVVGLDGSTSTDLVHSHYDYNPNNLRLLTKTVTDLTHYTSPYTTNGNTQVWTYNYTYWDVEETQLKTMTVDGPRNDVSDVMVYEYTQQGFLTKTTNALGHITQVLEHSPHGHPTKIININGLETRMTYHFRGWLETVAVENGVNDVVTTLDYDNIGQIVDIILPNGSSLHYDYDGAHRLYKIIDNSGAFIEYTLDAAGNQITQVIKGSGGNLVKSQTQLFDELSRLRESIGANNQSINYDYDANDNLASITDGKSNITGVTYDALDRLLETSNPYNNKANYTYDAENRITSVKDLGGVETTYQYDGFGNLMRRVSPDTGSTTYTYDDAGNRLSQTDARGAVTQYSYDVLNRLTAVNYPANIAENITYSYDDASNGNKGIGLLTGIVDESGDTDYVYDYLGNVLSKTYTIGANGYNIQYVYNLVGDITQITYSSGRLVHYSYDSLGRINGVTTQSSAGVNTEIVVNNVAYLSFGPVKSYTYGNGLLQRLSYDQDYRLINNQLIDTTIQLDLDYGYDLNGNISQIVDLLDGNNDQTFTYNKLNALIQGGGQYGQVNYRYFDSTNRREKTTIAGGFTTTDTYIYDASSNQLNQVGSDNGITQTQRSFQYGANGDLVQQIETDGTVDDYAYNEAGRYVQLDQAATVRAQYGYNALGQRISKVALGAVTITDHYHYDRAGRLLAVTDASGTTKREHIYLNDIQVAVLIDDAFATEWNSFDGVPIVHPSINFNNFTLGSYGGTNQDVEGITTIEDGGVTLSIVGNRWKYIPFPYEVTANTVLEFDFNSSSQGEIHSIGLDTDTALSSQFAFQLYGTQNWGHGTYKNYSGGNNIQHYSIPIGQYYTGQRGYLFFVMDHDVSSPTGKSVFSNVKVYEQ